MKTKYTGTFLIGGEIVDKPGNWHAYGWLDGLYYEPQNGWQGEKYSWAIDKYKYSYKRVMWLAVMKTKEK